MGRSVRQIRNLPSPLLRFEERFVPLPPGKDWYSLKNKSAKVVFIHEPAVRHCLKADGEFQELRPGDALVVPHPCVQHYQSAGGHNKQMHVSIIRFRKPLSPGKPTRSQEETLSSFFGAHFGFPRHLPQALEGEIKRFLRHLFDEVENRRQGYLPRANALCLEILVALARRFDPQEPGTAAGRMSPTTQADYLAGQIRQYLQDFCAHPIHLNDLAETFGRSESHLAASFRKVTGKTIFSVLNEIRIAEARTLLLSTEKDAKEIGRLCGFSDPTHFNRSFRRATGQTPLQYRLKSNLNARFSGAPSRRSGRH